MLTGGVSGACTSSNNNDPVVKEVHLFSSLCHLDFTQTLSKTL